MDLGTTENQRVKTLKQRNFAIIIAVILFISNFILVTILGIKDERIIIIPAHLKQPFWVSKYAVSNNYLEERAIFIVDRMLNVHKDNFLGNMDMVMRFIQPNSNAHQEIYKQMSDRHENIRKMDLSSNFHLGEIKTNGEKFEAIVEGKLIQYLSGDKSLEERKKYLLKFDYKFGDLMLQEFKEIK